MTLTVRLAREDEAPVVARLLADAFASFQPLYSVEGFAVTTPDVSAVRARWGEGPTWLACTDETLGTVGAIARPDGYYMRSMAVLPRARGQGVGRALLGAVEDAAIAAGAERVYLSTSPFLDAAIGLYLAAGYVRIPDGPHDLLGTPIYSMEKRLGGRR